MYPAVADEAPAWRGKRKPLAGQRPALGGSGYPTSGRAIPGIAGERSAIIDPVAARENDPMAYPELLDGLAAWVERASAQLERDACVVVTKDQRTHGKWCGTVEVEALQRVGFLSVWSSGELDAQVLRVTDPPDFFVLNEHRFVSSTAELEQALATFADVVRYTDPRDLPT